MNRSFVAMLACLLVSCFCCSRASADIVYSNFGPDDSFNTGSDAIVGNFGTNYFERGPGVGIVNSSYLLDSIEAPIYNGPSDTVTMSVYDSTPAGFPNVVLESATATAVNLGEIASFNFSGMTILVAGETYFFVAAAANDGMSSANWNFNDQGIERVAGDSRTRGSRNNGGNWAEFPSVELAIRVNATAIPEPAGLVLIGLPLLAMLVSRSRR